MGICFNFLKKKQYLGDAFEIKNGIAGINHDTIFHLIKLIHFKADRLVQNLIGISGEFVLWINHPHYPFCRIPKPNLRKQTITQHEREKEMLVKINTTNIIFYDTWMEGSVFLNVLVKKMILQCTIKIEFVRDTSINIGISTPSQLNDAITSCIGFNGCGASLYSYSCSNSSYIICNGRYFYEFKEGMVRNREKITIIINQKNNNNNSKSGGEMNFIRCGKKIPHTVINIPNSGVYLGFSSQCSFFILHVISLHKLSVPSFLSSTNGNSECIGYDFNGKFESCSCNYNHQDEEREEISNIKKFYKQNKN